MTDPDPLILRQIYATEGKMAWLYIFLPNVSDKLYKKSFINHRLFIAVYRCVCFAVDKPV